MLLWCRSVHRPVARSPCIGNSMHTVNSRQQGNNTLSKYQAEDSSALSQIA